MENQEGVERRKGPPGREEVVEAVRKALAERGGKRMTQAEFLAMSGLRPHDAARHHTGWNALLREAGCEEPPRNGPMDPERLLADYGRLTVELGRPPSSNEYKVRGKYSVEAFQGHFGSWGGVPAAFRAFAARRSAWKEALEMVPAPQTSRKRKRNPRRGRLAQRICDRPVCGAKLGIGGMGHAPTNEGGVVFLFGAMAERLGFEVEAFQASFPDCEAKRQVGPESWQNVKIEFEFESRNFRLHRHDPEGCDLIVCWAHNWPECPLEVIALRDEMERLGRFKK